MFNLLAMVFVCLGIVSAIIIAKDLNRNPQSMRIMNAVWILTALWAGYLALWAYFKFGREKLRVNSDTKISKDAELRSDTPEWQSNTLSVLSCGAAFTLGNIMGESFTYYYPVSVFGSALIGSWVIDFVLALIIGVYFQFYATRETERTSVGIGLLKAVKAESFSLISWQLGMYVWMAIVFYFISEEIPVEKSTWTFWLMMQIAMFFGFVYTYPMNALLIKTGVKKGL
ncbi:DUF4396 domain-containing protein [Bacteroides sp.]|uniref:DUF4396 domain-containing protein n=1 Tax=Bacteroides sp. TaxID=29523 RepID=UPI001B5F5B82|nr:DUF4396 domain-containing protein [Bacteroides sp.]MBP6065114.1 DUF4396 domain-containing protein [Bacteroides sp.]MBP6066878.1 DUF4396 domain-containing protein [Bacteroides sp.]MBP6936192.1 DUF4396 domain-containing protein [Bacteroides sp.]MBP8622362.1 DUF4396 domain-containing protein [Bacteroides sp.]MBP9586097.1 DUF4396 domain-containing protein [Bacteroides sp.]